jgi:GntR family transcriptional regulator, transcriptional repressor for pyruvate dehydrogenase complex
MTGTGSRTLEQVQAEESAGVAIDSGHFAGILIWFVVRLKPSSGVTAMPSRPAKKPTAAESVVAEVRGLIERGEVRSGDRLPPERELAQQLGVSRPSVRSGLKSLAAMGVVQIRQGAGTFITGGPPVLASEPLRFLAALHGFSRSQMFEARLVLEVAVAGLAAERAAPDKLMVISDETTGMFASLELPGAFLDHDIRFHQAVAAAAGNPILASVVEMVAKIFYEFRRRTIRTAKDLRLAAEEHRAIYQAIRSGDPERARSAMGQHLRRAALSQAQEDGGPASSPNDTGQKERE